jgi:hypothetical protein
MTHYWKHNGYQLLETQESHQLVEACLSTFSD